MKIFVHTHIFYANLWQELKEHLQNITVPYDLTVTFVEEHPETKADILKFKPDAKIMLVDNKGWDIGPFILALQSIDLNDYDYVIKLHTKRDLPGLATKNDIPFYCLVNDRLKFRSEWRRELLKFLSSKEIFNKCLNAFEKDPLLGMTAYFKLICNGGEGDIGAYNAAQQLMTKIGFGNIPFKFVAGTMFMARAKLLIPFQNIDKHIEVFTQTRREDISVSAHVLERALGGVICLQGGRIADVFTEKQKYGFPWREIFIDILRFFFQKRITNSGHNLIKVFKIPVYRKKVK